MISKILILMTLLCGALFGQEPGTAQTEFFLLNLIEISKDQFVVGQSPEQIDFQPIVKIWADNLGRPEKDVTAELQRWAEAAINGDDSFRKGLAFFYQKKFVKAAEAFNESAKEKSTQLTEAKEAGTLDEQAAKTLLMSTIRDIRLTGHALYHAYDFKNALTAYQQALAYIPKDSNPEVLAGTLFDMGQIYSEVGTKTQPPENRAILENAAKAFNAALDIYTMEKYPERWANANNRLGAVLAILGLNSTEQTEQKSDSLITAAVRAMKNAMKVVTLEKAPQQWAKIQNNLGATLSEHGYKVGGDKGNELVLASIEAYQNALKVRTRQANEQLWAKMHNNLAEAYFFLGDWQNVAESYTKVLEVYPENETAYFTAVNIYQTELFKFDKAYQLSEKWLKTHPNDLIEKVKFAEKCFTTSKYNAAQELIDSFVDNKDYSDLLHILMRILDVGNQIALKKGDGLAAKVDALILKIKDQRGDFKLNYNFDGLIHYVENTPSLAPHQQWLANFYRAVSKVDRDLIAEALQEVRAAL